MPEHRGIERRDEHDDERRADCEVHDVFLADALQRQREREDRHDRQSTTQSEQSRHETSGNTGDQIDGYKLHRHIRRASLLERSNANEFRHARLT
jgi:hypothetical protein